MDIVTLFLGLALCIFCYFACFGFFKELERFPRKLIVVDGENVVEYQVVVDRSKELVTAIVIDNEDF